MENTNLTRYVDIDFSSNQQALLARIQERWPTNWNDFLPSDFGVILVDLMSWNMATMAFLINRQAGEVFVPTFTLRESAVRIGALGGYRLHGPTPASVLCEVSIQSVLDSSVTIQKGTVVKASDDTPFEVSQDYTILPGDTTPVTPVVTFSPSEVGSNVLATLVLVTPGSENVDTVDSSIDLTQYVTVGQTFRLSAGSTPYTITSISAAPGAISNNRLVLDSAYQGSAALTTAAEVVDERVLILQGQTVTDQTTAPAQDTSNFFLTLSRTPVIDGSVVVTVNGVTWTEVQSAIDLGPSSTSFITKETTLGVTVIQFGDGQLGQAVPANSVIVATYRVGGGPAGNVPTGSINTSVIGFVSNTQNPVTVSITNQTSSGQGGQSEETLEEARTHIPLAFKANDRAVTLDDCQEVARAFPDGSVAFARAFANATNSILESNVITLYAWTTGPSGSLVPLSSGLKLLLKDWMTSRAMGTDYIVIADGTSRAAPIAFRFKVASGASLTDTIQRLNLLLQGLINALRPGDSIVYSDLVSQISSTSGVASVILATPNNDLTTNSSTELFTIPSDNFSYTVTKNYQSDALSTVDLQTVTVYTAQLPVAPLAPWAFNLALVGQNIAVVPGITPGTAQLYNTQLLSSDPAFPSYVNLLTGQAVLSTIGVVGDLTLSLITIQGYTTERTINVYANYTGLSTPEKRQEIRTRIRTWAEGLGIGSTLYGDTAQGVTISQSNLTAVIEATPDVDSVTKLSLGTPLNSSSSVVAGETELLKVGNIILNGNTD